MASKAPNPNTGHINQTAAEQEFMAEAFRREEGTKHKFITEGAPPAPKAPYLLTARTDASKGTRATPRSARSGLTTTRTDTSVTTRMSAIEELRRKRDAIERELAEIDRRIEDKAKSRKPKKAERPFAAFPSTHRDANKTTNSSFF